MGKPGASGDPLSPKPRYMRWATYHRLQRMVLRLEIAGCAAVSGLVNAVARKTRYSSTVHLSCLALWGEDHPSNDSFTPAADNRPMALLTLVASKPRKVVY